MKNFIKSTTILCLFALIANSSLGQSIELFETETAGTTTFTDLNQDFTIVTGDDLYEIVDNTGEGWNGTAADDKYIESTTAFTALDGSSVSIFTTDNNAITVDSFYLKLATAAIASPTTTDVTVEAFLNGVSQFSFNKTTGFVDPATGSRNGFTLIDIAAESAGDELTLLDSLVITSTLDGDYMAIDGFAWAGQALSFDGVDDDESTTLTNNGIENISANGFTIESWVFANGFSHSWRSLIVNKEGDYALYVTNTNTLVAQVWIDGTISVIQVTGPGSFPTGSWTHVAFSWDGNNGVFYVDGTPTAGTNSAPGGNASTSSLQIGHASGTNVWDGKIDEVRIWRCVKSATDISNDESADLVGSENGLIAYYDFSNGSGTTVTDLSASGNDLTLAGATTAPLWTSGVNTSGAPTFTGCVFGALSFDGVDDHATMARANLGVIGHTIEAWVKTTSTATGSAYAGNPALAVLGDNDNNIGMTFGVDNGFVQYNHYNGVWNTLNGSIAVNDGAWHHIAVTHNIDNTVTIYVDGVSDNTGSFAISTNSEYTSYNLIGASILNGSAGSNDNYFDGEIDEVRAWTCAKSAADISADMTAVHTGSEIGMVLFYDFSDGAGTTVTDLSNNSNDATLAAPTSTPLWVTGITTAGAPTFTGCPHPEHYWVGSTGNWSDAANHWASTSGGTPGSAPVPTRFDIVIFDNNSGLENTSDTVYLDVNPHALDLELSTIDSAFVFTGPADSITVYRSLYGNDTIDWQWTNLMFMATDSLNADLTSNGTIWPMSFEKDSTQSLTITDSLRTLGNLTLTRGELNTTDNFISCLGFISDTNLTRTWDVGMSDVRASGDSAFILNATNLTVNTTGSRLYTDAVVTAQIMMSNIPFDTLVSASDTLRLLNDADFDSIFVATTSYIEIPADDTLKFEVLEHGSGCTTPLEITGLGTGGYIQNTGSADLTITAVTIDNVDADTTVAFEYNIADGDTINGADLWNLTGRVLYWFGDAGDWSDLSHWSLTSGGPVAITCPLTAADTVIFDNNSFSADGFEVRVTSPTSFAMMDWSTDDDASMLRLDDNIFAGGDVTMNADLTIEDSTTLGAPHRFEIDNISSFSPDSAYFNCDVSILLKDSLDTVDQLSYLSIAPERNLFFANGVFNTNENDIHTGSIITQTLNANFSRTFIMDSSHVMIREGFLSENDPTFTISTTGSLLELKDSLGVVNFIQTEGLTFGDVIIDIQPTGTEGPWQRISGDNTFQSMIVRAGSHLTLDSLTTQTFIDSLILDGTCYDSIFVRTSDTVGTVDLANVVLGGLTNFDSEVVGYRGINVNSAVTTLFSNDLGDNTNITFSPDSAIVPSFTYSTPTCFGDTVFFTNTSTSYQGDPENGTYYWYYNDGTLVYEYDSTFVAVDPSDTLTYMGMTGGYWQVDSTFFTNVDSILPNYGYYEIVDTFLVLTADSLDTIAGQVGYWELPDSIYITALDSLNGDLGYYVPDSNFVTLPLSAFDTINGTVGYFLYDSLFISPLTTVSGQLGYYRPDSTLVDYEIDTLAHVFLISGEIPISMIGEYTNGCQYEYFDTINITNTDFQLFTSETDLEICVGEEVTFEANGNDPENPFAYQYFVNGTAVNATPSIADSIYITSSLSDGDTVGVNSHINGCVSDTMTYLVYDVRPIPVFPFTVDDPDTSICALDSITFTGGPLDSTYSFRFFVNGAAVTSFLDSVNIYSNNNFNDNDSIALIGRNEYGCRDTLHMILNVDSLPSTTLTASTLTGPICDDDTITFTASNADTYEFFIDGVSIGAASATNTYVTDTLQSNQVVTVVGYNSFGCEREAPETFSYIVNPLPNISLNVSDADTLICSGENVTFTAAGASLYEFFINGTSQGAQSPTTTLATTSLANNDSIFVVGEFSGCSNISDTVVFAVNLSPTTTLTSTDADTSICAGTLVTFTGGGATNYEYFINGNSQGPSSTTNTFATSTLQNNEIVTLVGESNGCTVSQTMTFEVLTVPFVDIFSDDIDNTICNGETITFTGATADNYELFIDGVSQGAPQPGQTFTPALPIGTSSVYIVGTLANGCSTQSQNTLSVTVNPIPTVSLTSSDADQIICDGELVTIYGTGSDNYQFFVDGTPVSSLSSQDSVNLTTLTTGQTVTALGESLGCSSNSTNSFTFTVNPVPVISLMSDDLDNVFCADQVVTFTSGGATDYEFIVDGVSQGPASPTNTINSSTFTPGTYSVDVIGTTNGCSATQSMTINMVALPVAGLTTSVPTNSFCEGESVTVTGSGGDSYQFFVNAVATGPATPQNTYTSNTWNNGDVITVLVSSAAGCPAPSVPSVTMTVYPNPTVGLVSSDADTNICVLDNVDFTASGANTYEFFINGVSQGAPSATNTLSTTTLADGDVIIVDGYNAQGCSSTSSTIQFDVFQYPVVSLINTGDTILCTGEIPAVEANGATNYQYAVNGVPVGPFVGSNLFPTGLNDGDVVTVLGETNGCASAAGDAFTFTVYPYPTIAVAQNPGNVICFSDTLELTASGAMEYEFVVNGFLEQSGASPIFEVSQIPDGSIIQITGFNEECPSAVETINMTVHEMDLNISALPGAMICDGENVTFTGSGADEYEFTINDVSVTAMTPTNTYASSTLADGDVVGFLGLNNTTGCTQKLDNTIIMNVLPTPAITASGSTTFCEGDSVTLFSSEAYGNQWYLDGAPIAGATDTSLTVFDSGDYSLEITSGGNDLVWSVGYNANGTFGDGSNFDDATPVPTESMEQFDEIATGFDFAMGVNTAGDLYGWGENSSGQLGQGTFTASNTPIVVPGITDVKTVATSSESVMATTSTGDVYVWGNNTFGQLGTGNFSVINFPFANPALTGVDSVAAGRDHFVVLLNNGTVMSVGDNTYGQLGDSTLNSSNTPIAVNNLTNIVSVGAGEYHSFAIDNAGVLYVWGNNSSGQLGMGDLDNRLEPAASTLQDIVHAEGGANHSVFMRNDGKAFTSGGNVFGQLGDGTNNATTSSVQVPIANVAQVSAGQYTSLFLRNDGSVFGAGNNQASQLYATGGTSFSTPIQMDQLNGATFVESGRLTSHIIAGNATSCLSPVTTTTMLSTPPVTITYSNDTLLSSGGDSFQWYFDGNPIPGATSSFYVPDADGTYYVEVTYANGCSTISNDFILDTQGIGEYSINMNIHPNPTNDVVNVVLDGYTDNFEVALVDQLGRVQNVPMTAITNGMQLDLSKLAYGAYHVVITLNGISFTEQVVKQ